MTSRLLAEKSWVEFRVTVRYELDRVTGEQVFLRFKNGFPLLITIPPLISSSNAQVAQNLIFGLNIGFLHLWVNIMVIME
jgi:hypothetical protein